MGNRGIVHDDARTVVRSQGARAWIVCAISFKGRTLPLMEPGANTQLFFLDEATALAAGHRPCFECRRPAATDFLGRWRTATSRPDAKVGELDALLSEQRRVPRSAMGAGKISYRHGLGELPDGAFVEVDGGARLVHAGQLLPWTHSGYDLGRARAAAPGEVGWVLTPRTVVDVLRAGYRPALHPTATG